MSRRGLRSRFWEAVAMLGAGPDDCWEWTGARDENGYGRVSVDGTSALAHRVAFSFENDPGDLFVLHSCDNPPCCNPRHLRLGTAKDNSADMVARKRYNNPRRPTCQRGHPFTPENTYTRPDEGTRQCRTCNRDNARHFRRRKQLCHAL